MIETVTEVTPKEIIEGKSPGEWHLLPPGENDVAYCGDVRPGDAEVGPVPEGDAICEKCFLLWKADGCRGD